MTKAVGRKFIIGDKVVIARPHPTEGYCGLNPLIAGKGAEIVAPAISTYSEESYLVRIRHPLSGRIITPTLPACMFEPWVAARQPLARHKP